MELYALLKSRYGKRIHILTGNYGEQEVKGIIGRCDMFIGSRMHACIAALSQGIPTIGIAYSKKFRGVFKTVGAEAAVLDARYMSTEEIVAACIEALNTRLTLEKELRRQALAVKGQVEIFFREVIRWAMYENDAEVSDEARASTEREVGKDTVGEETMKW